MKCKKFILSLTAACTVLFCCSAKADEGEAENATPSNVVADSGFGRYQSIIDRQPFGPPPPGFDPSLPVSQASANGAAGGTDGAKTEAELSAEEQKMMSSVRVSVLNVTPAGATMVGFTDSTTQPPVNYYLKVGDTSTDSAKWLVKSADPSTGSVTLSKDGIDINLAVGDETKKGAPAGKPSPALGMVGRRPFGRGSNVNDAAGKAADNGREGTGALGRLRQRRAQRRAEEEAQQQAADKARAEIEAKEKEAREIERERAAAEREQQREALLQIQEELRRAREAKAAQRAEEEQSEAVEE